MIPVYESIEAYERGDCAVARVKGNRCLDYLDGNTMQNGGVGMHKGITKLSDGSFVIIHSTDWIGGSSFAYVVSDREALNQILRSDHDELLTDGRFARLKKIIDEMPKEVEE